MGKQQIIAHFKSMLAPMGLAFLQSQMPPAILAMLPPGTIEALPSLLKDESEGDEETGTPQSFVQYFAVRTSVSDKDFREAVERYMMTDGNLSAGMKIAFAIKQHMMSKGKAD